MPRTFEYDVFLSYSSSDLERVARLARRLKDAGVKVWFDEDELRPGTRTVTEVERGLEASRRLVQCLTRKAVSSDWAAFERDSVIFRDPSNTDRAFIPVVFEDFPLPDTLSRYQNVDYR